MSPLRLLGACLLASLAGCRSTTPPGAFLSSTPSGARVRIDGRDSGFVTPCQLDLDSDDRVRVDLELEGFVPASIVLAPHSSTEVIGWSHGHPMPMGTWWLPILLPAGDLFLPYRPDHGHQPQRVHVRLLSASE